MKKTIYSLLAFLVISATGMASSPKGIKINKDTKVLKSLPTTVDATAPAADEDEKFTPSVSVGGIVHMYAGVQQKGFAFGGDPSAANGSDWESDFTVYRSRIMLGAQLSKKGNFFMETELNTSINGDQVGGGKQVRIQPMILDCQYEHVFSNAFSVVSGLQLVSHNRNGLQGAAGLMANDFTYFQYPNNMHPTSPLQGNLGRDLGVNFRGFFLDDQLEYRLGFFTGRTSFEGTTSSPIRTVGRVVYNVFDADKSYYYNGTNLGEGKTLSIGAGADVQGSYSAVGLDAFLDMPVSDQGSITANGAFSYISGGNDTEKKYDFSGMIPTQYTQYLELGYYNKKMKLQPWVRYEKQDMASEDMQVADVTSFDKLNTTTVLGGGVNYWFNSYNTNLRLSYTSATTDIAVGNNAYESKTYGQFWLQVQVFIF